MNSFISGGFKVKRFTLIIKHSYLLQSFTTNMAFILLYARYQRLLPEKLPSLLLKLKLLGHLMRRVDSLEKALMLGGIGAIGDGFHFNASFLSDFKLGKDTFTESQYSELCCLGRRYSEEIKRHPTVSYNAGKKIVNYSHWEAMATVRKIEKLIIEALDLPNDFASHIEQWYLNQVHCNRDNEKR